MSRLFMLPIGALVSVAVAAPVAAQAPDQDVRCMLASQVFARTEKDDTKRRLAQVSSFFYVGRLDARMNPAQLKSAIVTEGKRLKPAELGPVMTACVQRLQAKTQALEAIGRSLTPPAAAAPK